MPLCALADLTNQKGFGKQAREQWHAFIPRSSNQFHCYRFRLRFVKRKNKKRKYGSWCQVRPSKWDRFWGSMDRRCRQLRCRKLVARPTTKERYARQRRRHHSQQLAESYCLALHARQSSKEIKRDLVPSRNRHFGLPFG